MDTKYKELIESTIRTLINQFYRKPFNFFNEHEFHQCCFHILYQKKEFSKQFITLDKKKTNILHPEYPTIKRYNRKKITVDPKGRRARYDMAILNPYFIVNNRIVTVINRDIKKASKRKENLIAAIEFKFITKHNKKFQHEIDYDFYKLSNAEESISKYMLVFSNTIKNEIDYFKSINKNVDVNIAYIAVYAENNGKKKLRIKEYPKAWLKTDKYSIS